MNLTRFLSFLDLVAVLNSVAFDKVEDDDVPPPLEDMSSILHERRDIPTRVVSDITDLQDKKNLSRVGKSLQRECFCAYSADWLMNSSPSPFLVQKASPSTNTKVQSASPAFSGLKKGFFSSSPKPAPSKSKTATKSSSQPQIRTAAQSSPPPSDIPFLKSNPTATNPLVFSEVRDAMANEMDRTRQNWMTPAFLEKLESSPKLAKAFSDPLFLHAANEMARDPAQAMKKYGKENPDFLEAMKEFVALMGNTLSESVDPQSTASASNTPVIPEDLPDHEKKLVQNVLSDPEVQDILRDREVQALLAAIQSDPRKQMRILGECGPVMRAKLMKLVDVGLLSIQ